MLLLVYFNLNSLLNKELNQFCDVNIVENIIDLKRIHDNLTYARRIHLSKLFL